MQAAVANSLVQALTWRLREMRIRVGLFEVEQAAAVLSTQEDWNKEELQRALLPIFCKRHEQRGLVSALIDELLTPPSPPPPHRVEDKTPIARVDSPPTGSNPEPGFWPYLRARVTLFFEVVRNPKFISWLLYMIAVLFLLAAFFVLFPDSFSVLCERLALLIRSISDAVSDPLGRSLISTNEESEAFALLVRHGTVAALIASSVIAVILTFSLRGKPDDRLSENHKGKPAPVETKGDSSVFRIGSLGGPPPRFLTPQLATEIVELLNYRQTDRDRRELDLPATVDSRVRGDMDKLIFKKRKELPTVVILADGAGDAGYWNTIAAEFQTALERRGLTVETFAYFGSISETSSLVPYQSSTIASALETIAERSGWMLTTVFADLRRLSRRDASLLADLREQGPVLAFDYNDPRLWDRRHEMLDSLGIAPHPATGPALRQALAAAFAPDRAAMRQGGLAKSGEAVLENLSEPHAQWASACAMVEPVSFALAEKLRGAWPQLSGADESLAFSLLARLPGSWIGPEGLRFSAQIRRHLLSRSSATPRDQQFAVLRVLDEAFGEEPKSITAAELWRYTRAQAELFTPRLGRALQDLADIKAGGLIDESQFDDFVQRLRQPGEPMQPGTTIALPLRSSRILALAGTPRPEQTIGMKTEIVAATWSFGLSEVRIMLGADAAPLAAFLPGGRDILMVEPGVMDPQRMFSHVDAVRGSRGPLSLREPLSNLNLAPPVDFTQLLVFPHSRAGVLTTRPGRLFSFLQSGDASNTSTELLPNLSLGEIPLGIEIGSMPLVALSAEGNHFACCGLRSSIVVVGSVSEEMRPQQISLPGSITAIAFSQAWSVLCGLESGDVFRITGSPSGFDSPKRIASFGLEITALTETVAGANDQSTIVAALSNGRIALGGSQMSDNVDLAMPWRSRWLTAFPDRMAALVDDTPVGLSVAATGPSGEFDVVGLPLYDERYKYQGESLISETVDPTRDGIAILAINAERRRILVRNGLYLEVRPLLYDLPEPGAAKVGVPIEDAPPSAPQPILGSVEQQAVTV